MATEWTDVADNAVKIGLGAIVGGGFSYLALWKTHTHEIAKEQAKRRQEMFEKLTDDFYSARAFFLSYYAEYLTTVDPNSDQDVRVLALSQIKEMLHQGIPTVHKMYVTEAKLKLLGFPETAKAAEYFRLACIAFHTATIQHVKPTEAEVKAFGQTIHDASETFIALAAKDYAFHPVTIRSGIAWWVYLMVGLGVGLAIGYCGGLLKH